MSPPVTQTVLYVEDEEYDFLFMRVAFGKAGIGGALQGVGDGQQAIDYLSGRGAYSDRGRHPLPTVLLLDLNLPVISGFEVLKWLRACPEFRTMPVVVFSSSSREEDRQKAKELGANHYVEKPRSGNLFGQVVDWLTQNCLKA